MILCHCNREMVPRPVPGATRFPTRLECPAHGYRVEKRTPLVPEEFDPQDMAEFVQVAFGNGISGQRD